MGALSLWRPAERSDPPPPQDKGDGDDAALLVHVNDLHVNSTVALCPHRVRRDDGGIYEQSKEQGWIWEKWEDFWWQVKARKQKLGVPVFTILNGDLVDLNQHSQMQLVEPGNPFIILAMAQAVLEPARLVSDYLFVLRGTEAHVGGSGYLEELLAQALGAVPDEDKGTFSWWHLALVAAGVRGDFSHHPQTSSRRPWTRDSAAARQAAITWSEYMEMGEPAPHIVGRAHVHYWAKGYKDDTFAFFGPPWQLSTAFGYRLGTGRKIEPVGGVIIGCRSGRYWWEDIRYAPPRGRVWTVR